LGRKQRPEGKEQEVMSDEEEGRREEGSLGDLYLEIARLLVSCPHDLKDGEFIWLFPTCHMALLSWNLNIVFTCLLNGSVKVFGLVIGPSCVSVSRHTTGCLSPCLSFVPTPYYKVACSLAKVMDSEALGVQSSQQNEQNWPGD